MISLASTLKELWKPPQLRTLAKERHATWLELFFDLVFVLTVAELGSVISHDLSLDGLLKFGFLFLPVWYAWFHHTIFSDRFDTDNFAHRFLTIVLMLGVVGIGASIHGAFEETGESLAASFVLVKIIMIIFYQRCVQIEVAKPLANRLSLVFAISGILWFASIFISSPIRFWLWGLAIFSEYIIVLSRSTRVKYAVMPVTVSHIVERFGLFTIIVLGESVSGIVKGLTESSMGFANIVIAVLGLLLVFGYWWIYFENLDGSALKGLGGWWPLFWLYVQLPLVMSLTVLGISLEHLIAEGTGHIDSSTLWFMVISLAISYYSIAVTHLTVSKTKPEAMNPLKGRGRLFAATMVVFIGWLGITFSWSSMIIVGTLTLISMAQVFGELFAFKKTDHSIGTVEEL